MAEAETLRVWTVLLQVESGGIERAVSYEVWAADERQAARLAMADLTLRQERALDALRVEVGGPVMAEGAMPHVRFRASQFVRLKAA